jgi:ABC-2 type transport system ATP-binding protein
MITVQNLHKKFKSFHALKGIDLHVKKGEIYGFIGQNGAGKSTTMNILAGLSRPNEGHCIVNGLDVTKIRHPSELHIGYLPEDPRFYPWMTARETLNYLGNSPQHRTDQARIDEMLNWIGLENAALIHDPELLILDEPSSALDPEGRSDVLRLIRDLKQMGKTVFFSSHILNDVERICDTVGMIAAGVMKMEKPLDVILKENILPIYDVTLQMPIDPATLDMLKQVAGVTDVTAHNDRLSIATADADSASTHLMRFFSEHDLALRSFSLRENDLENIFIQEVNGK